MLDDENLDRALAAGVQAVGISIDGMQATHDDIRVRLAGGPSAWRTSMAAVERAQTRVETIVITAVNRRNLGELPDIRAAFNAMGVKRWQIQLVIPVGRVLEITEPFVIAPAQLESLMAFIADARGDGKPPHIDTSDTIGYFTERELGVRGSVGTPSLWTGCQAGIRAVAMDDQRPPAQCLLQKIGQHRRVRSRQVLAGAVCIKDAQAYGLYAP